MTFSLFDEKMVSLYNGRSKTRLHVRVDGWCICGRDFAWGMMIALSLYE